MQKYNILTVSTHEYTHTPAPIVYIYVIVYVNVDVYVDVYVDIYVDVYGPRSLFGCY